VEGKPVTSTPKTALDHLAVGSEEGPRCGREPAADTASAGHLAPHSQSRRPPSSVRLPVPRERAPCSRSCHQARASWPGGGPVPPARRHAQRRRRDKNPRLLGAALVGSTPLWLHRGAPTTGPLSCRWQHLRRRGADPKLGTRHRPCGVAATFVGCASPCLRRADGTPPARGSASGRVARPVNLCPPLAF
jgi:hypothetical protein